MHNTHSSHLAAWGATVLALIAVVVGCGGAEDAPAESAQRPEPSAREQPTERLPRLEPARCPPGLADCVEASGTVIYVERVDPDGDGDAHFVLSSREGVTFPGVTVVDVRRDLRPDPLPGPGDRLSAAGPVFTGSYGQRQIQAEVVNVAR